MVRGRIRGAARKKQATGSLKEAAMSRAFLGIRDRRALEPVRCLRRLTTLAGHADAAVRLRAIKALVDVHTLVVPALVATVGDDDPEVQQAGIAAVGSLGSAALDSVAELFRSASPRFRLGAVRVFASAGPGARPLVANALGDDDAAVRNEARSVLRALGQDALGPLTVALKDPGPRARMEAAALLGGILDAQAVSALIAGIDDGDEAVRAAVVNSLLESGTLGLDALRSAGPTAIASVAGLLYSGSARIRDLAVRTLSGIGPLAVPAVVAALDAPDAFTRRDAISALGAIAGPASAGHLVSALIDSDAGVRDKARSALRLIGGDGVKALTEALADHDPGMRTAAAAVLGEIDDPAAVTALIDKVDDAELELRSAAARSLIRSGTAGLRSLRDLLSTREVALPDACQSDLVNALRGWDEEKRQLAAQVMLFMGAQQRADATLTMVSAGFGAEIVQVLRATLRVAPLLSRELADETTDFRVRLAYYSALDDPGAEPPLPQDERQRLVEQAAKELRRLAARTRTESYIAGYHDVTHTVSSGGVLYCLSARSVAYDSMSTEETIPEPYYETRNIPDPDRVEIARIIAVVPQSLREAVRSISGSAEPEFDAGPERPGAGIDQ